MNTTLYKQKRFAADVTAADKRGQRSVVQSELDAFDASLDMKLQSKSGPSAVATTRQQTHSAEDSIRPNVNLQLRSTVAFPQAGPSLPRAVLRVQAAARCLAQCPASTLRVLQRRVLCAHEATILGYCGVPTCLQPYTGRLPFAHTLHEMYENAGHDNTYGDSSTSGNNIAPELEPPALEPITFQDFMLQYLAAVEPQQTHEEALANGALLAESRLLVKGATKSRQNGNDRVTLSREYLRPVLAAPTPATAIAAVSAPYDMQRLEASLCFALDTEATDDIALQVDHEKDVENIAATTAARAAIMHHVVQWNRFFADFFDEVRTGVCEDTVSLLAAILLACGLKGELEAGNTTEARQEEAVRSLRQSSRSGRCRERNASRACCACQHSQHVAEERCRYTASTSAATGSPSPFIALDSPRTRFFLGCAAITFWVQSFLRLHRCSGNGSMAGSGGEHAGAAGEEGAALPPAEVLLIRDWIDQQGRAEARCLQLQQQWRGGGGSTLCIARTCATGGPVLKVPLGPEQVTSAVGAITEYVNDSLLHEQPLKAPALLRLLREMLPVTAYYATFYC